MAAHHGERARVLFASKAFPCTAVLRIFAEEGLGVDVASGGELHLALQGGLRARRGSSCTATRSPRPSCATAVERRRRGRRSTTSTRSTGWSGLAGGGPQRGAAARRPRGRRPTPTTPSRPATPTRSSASRSRRRAAAIERLRGAGWADLRGHPRRTSARSSSTSRPIARRSRRSPGSGASRSTTSAAGSRVAYTAEHRPPSVDEWVARVVGAAHELLGAQASRAVDRARPRAGRQRGRHALHRRVGQAARLDLGGGRRRHDATTCARCSTARRTTADVADRVGAEGDAVPPRRQALRVRRRDRPGRAAAPTRGRATCSSPPPPAPTATRWPTTTTACHGRR